jgi:hypothetical protein
MRYWKKLAAIALLILSAVGMTSASSSREQQIVTRVDDVLAVRKHKTLEIQALGMGRTPSAMDRGGWLVRRGSGGPNKEGLLEYDLMFKAVPGYTGFKLKPVKAKLNERNAPDGVKGVRIFGQYNQMDGLLPEVKPKEKKSLNPFHRKKKPVDTGETAGSIAEPTPH